MVISYILFIIFKYSNSKIINHNIFYLFNFFLQINKSFNNISKRLILKFIICLHQVIIIRSVDIMKKKTIVQVKAPSILQGILKIFSQVQNLPAPNKTLTMQLLLLQKQNHIQFNHGFQQCYLKIFKSLQERANKKIPQKFQTFFQMVCKELLNDNNQQSLNSLNFCMQLLTEVIYSSVMNIRIMGARILFIVLRNMPTQKPLDFFLTQQTLIKISKCILFLLRLKVSTYRQLGIKLSSLILPIKNQICQSIEAQLFKIISTQQNQQLRKMVATNIPITTANISQLLVRLRDKCPQIRAILLRKLTTQKFKHSKMNLKNLYKLLYDGYGSKDLICKEETLRYFYSYFSSQPELSLEEKLYKFVQMFQPNILLINSHLYVLFNKLVEQLLLRFPSNQISEQIRKLCLKCKNCMKDKQIKISYELIWLKNSSISQSKDVSTVFQQFCPSGSQLASILINLTENKDIFALNQFFQLFSNIKMPDQIGANRMFDTLKNVLTKLQFFQVKKNFQSIQQNDQICNIQRQDQINFKKNLLSYYDFPIISNSMDLIYSIVVAMKSLRPTTFYLELQQNIAEWNNPQLNIIFNDRQTKELALERVKQDFEKNPNSSDKQKYLRLIETLNKDLSLIYSQIQYLRKKTINCIIALSKLKNNWNIDHYLPIIKDQLTNKKDQSQGLILLGLYCLQDIDKVKMFFQIFWEKMMSNDNKIHLLVSLKIITDFITKFNILKHQQEISLAGSDQSFYNNDIFMARMIQLILDKDPDIKIFSIECLCKIIYHKRVDQNNLSTYFLYLLLLWWQTSSEEVSSRSVHTISLFFRSYIQKGNDQVKKLSEMLCIFHKILMKFQMQKKTINRQKIKYNLKMQELIKKTVSIAMTVLKYHKQKKTIWNYEEVQLGPQEFFLLYVMHQKGFQNMLQKPLNTCDFFEKCPLQTLIFMKKKIEEYDFSRVNKKTQQQIRRFQVEIQNRIQIKGQEVFSQDLIKLMDKILNESILYINTESSNIAKNIESQQIFIKLDDQSEDQRHSNQQFQSISPSSDDQQQVEDPKRFMNQRLIRNQIMQKEQDIQNSQPNIVSISDQSEEIIQSFSKSQSRKKIPKSYPIKQRENEEEQQRTHTMTRRTTRRTSGK